MPVTCALSTIRSGPVQAVMVWGRRTGFRGLLCLVLCLLSGCASLITASFPPEVSYRYGSKQVGESASYRYRFKQAGRNSFVLERAPLCAEVQQKLEVSRKRMRGVLVAIAEIPFFGLGLADLLLSDALAKNSEQSRQVGLKPTGKLLPCGAYSVFPHAKVMIQIPDLGRTLFLSTDDQGQLNLDTLVKRARFRSLNVFVVQNEDFYYLTTLYAH